MFETQAQSTIPSSISFTDQDIKDATARPTLKEGWFYFRVTSPARNGTTKNGHLSQSLILAPVDDMGETNIPTIQHRVILPFLNTEFEGHVKPRTFGFCQQYLHAAQPKEHGAFPKKEGGAYTTEDGSVLDYDSATEYRETLSRAVYEEMQRRWESPELYAGEEFFGKVVQNGEFLNVEKLRPVAPDDEEVEYSSFMA